MSPTHRAARSLALFLAMAAVGISPCFASGSAEDSTRAFIQTGHKGSVLSMEYSQTRGLLFTSGEDGSVRAWDTARKSLRAVVHVGRHPVDMVALNDAAQELAVLETDGVGYFAVSAWNWAEDRMLFRIPLDQAPLFLRYSDSGSYLTFGVPRWDGFVILKSSDGSRVSFHTEGFGIVSFAEISRSEKTVMTYQPSGRIAYWDMASGSLVKEIRTIASLSQARISADMRFLLGTTRSDVVLLDLVSGAVKSRVAATGSLSVDLAENGAEAAIFNPDSQKVQRWNPAVLQSGRLAPGAVGPAPGGTAGAGTTSGAALAPAAAPGSVTVPGGAGPSAGAPVGSPAAAVFPTGLSIVRYAGNELFAAGRGGQVWRLPASGAPELFARDETADVSGLAASEDEIALASPQWIWVFPASGPAAGSPPPRIMPNPLSTPAGIGFVPDGRMAVWNKDGDRGVYAVINADGTVTRGSDVFANPLLQGVIQDGALIGLERGGTIRSVDLRTGKQLFSIWLPGTNRIALIDSQLVAARSVTGMTERPLVSVNMKTGETVPLQGASVFCYDLAYDAQRGLLYSLGVDAGGGTGLYVNSGRSFDQQTRITGVPEDLTASIVFDSRSGLLYTSLGFEGVKTWDGRTLASLSAGDGVPRRIAAARGVLCALNMDSSVGLWDSTGAWMGGLHLFSTGDWCLLLPGGRYAASDGGAAMVKVVSDGVEAPNTADYRIVP